MCCVYCIQWELGGCLFLPPGLKQVNLVMVNAAWRSDNRQKRPHFTTLMALSSVLNLKYVLTRTATQIHIQTDTYTLPWVTATPLRHLEWTSKEMGTCAGWNVSGMTLVFGDELCSHRRLAVMATLTEDKATGLQWAAGSILEWHVGYRWHANTVSLVLISHEPRAGLHGSQKIVRQQMGKGETFICGRGHLGKKSGTKGRHVTTIQTIWS